MLWDIKFSRRWVWCSELSSGIYCRDDGGSTHLWNVGRQLLYTAVHPRRQSSLMEAVRTSETSVDNYFTRQYIPEENHHPWWRQYARLKRRSTIILHGSTSQKTIIADDGGSTDVWNVGRQLFYTAVHPRRQSSLMMEAVRTSETSVDNYFTRQYIPEDNSEHC
jgi:hypothetical protein